MTSSGIGAGVKEDGGVPVAIAVHFFLEPEEVSHIPKVPKVWDNISIKVA